MKSGLEEEHGRFVELLYEVLESALGSARIYELALRCARNPALLDEWSKYSDQVRRRVEVVERIFLAFGLDSGLMTLGRRVARARADGLMDPMRSALTAGFERVEIVATECVVDAEAKDRKNWELISAYARTLEDNQGAILKDACNEVEDQLEEHLHHGAGWSRELSLEALGLDAVLPPPERRAGLALGAPPVEPWKTAEV